MGMITVFGFGSLMNSESLRASVPDAKPQAAYIKGFRRSFNLWDPAGFTTTNPDVAGIPFCALDISKVGDETARVNGVVFEVDEASFADLQTREAEYELIEAICYDYKSNKQLGECFVYSANKDNGVFDQNNKAQQRYLKICLDGAEEYGEDFYQNFLTTTYVGKDLLGKFRT